MTKIAVQRSKSRTGRHGLRPRKQLGAGEKAKMSGYKLTRDEMETIIRGSAGSRAWEVVTGDARIIRYMAKQGYSPDDRPNPWGYISFAIPSDKVRIGKAGKRKLPEGHSFLKRTRNSVASGDQNPTAMVG